MSIKSELANVKISLRTDALSNWTNVNPILKSGEVAIVIDENGNENIKIGNGISAFNDLKYLNQNEFKTDKIIAKDITAKSISQGYNVKSTPTSLATGIFSEADGNFDVVHGIEAKALSTDDYAFVFNGTNLPGISERYTSHGEGTFNINPLNGLSGFYVGDRRFADIVSDPFKTMSLIKPHSENSLFLSVEISESKDFNGKIIVDSSTTSQYFNGFSDGIWKTQPSTGFGTAYNDQPVEILFREILNAASRQTNEDSHFYVKYNWYWKDSEDAKHYSDSYSLILPTNTEVGANSRDVASKIEFETLRQQVNVQTTTITESQTYSNYWFVNDTDFNEISETLSSNDTICLNDYDENKHYNVKFTTGNAETMLSVKIDVGNGPENSNYTASQLTFKENSTYAVDFFHDQVIVKSINNLDFQKYADSKMSNQFKTFSMIKPYSESLMFCELTASLSSDFSNSISIDSAASCQLFAGFVNNNINPYWEAPTSDGFAVDFNNQPIKLDLGTFLKDNNWNLTDRDTLYVKYLWYWKDASGNKHKSDTYSAILPTNTEVGANSHDVASKREFNSLTQIVMPTTRDIGLDEEYEAYYEVRNDILANLTATIQNNDKILLHDYSEANSYKMQFKTVDADNNISVKFYVDYGNGPEYDDALAINANAFMPNTEYSIDVKNNCIIINSINKRDVVNYLKENSNSVTLRVWEDD